MSTATPQLGYLYGAVVIHRTKSHFLLLRSFLFIKIFISVFFSSFLLILLSRMRYTSSLPFKGVFTEHDSESVKGILHLRQIFAIEIFQK